MAEENRAQRATLGCGTLILIALIVMFFSKPGDRDIERELRGVRSELQALKDAVNGLTAKMTVLQEKVERRD